MLENCTSFPKIEHASLVTDVFKVVVCKGRELGNLPGVAGAQAKSADCEVWLVRFCTEKLARGRLCTE